MPQATPKSAATKVTEQVAKDSQKLAESARQIKASSASVEDSADRTTRLAADRTVLAAERTYAAWTRTALVALASGIGARPLLNGLIPNWLILAQGSVLIAFCIFCLAAAVWRHLYAYQPPPRPDAQQMPPWILVSVNGFLAAVAFMALVGLWIVTLY